MRVVTFQTRDITDRLLLSGTVETLGGINSTKRLRTHCTNDLKYIKANGEVKAYDTEGLKSITDLNNVYRVFPFYAYHTHSYCGESCVMSIRIIYKLASYFMGFMDYSERDIIELEVPDEVIISVENIDGCEVVLLPRLEKEWLVSVLRFEDFVTETAYGENALLYRNEIYNTDTYRMCYSRNVVINGHGYGDILECCLSPDLLHNVSDVAIQREYVQTGVWNLFVKYLYAIHHRMPLSDIGKVRLLDARNELPEKIDTGMIAAFNMCKSMLVSNNSVVIYDNNLTYSERMSKYYK